MVDGFWANRATEPKRQYRWLMSLNGIDSWIIKSTDKPSFDIGESSHSFLNYDFKFPGRVKWNDISVTLVDPVYPDATATLNKILYGMGYVFPDDPQQQGQQAMTISKRKAVNAISPVLIKQLDADGTDGFLEVWKLENCWIKNVKFGKLEYKSDEVVEISMTLVYDWAVLNDPKTPVNLIPGAGEPSDKLVIPE